MIFKVSKHIMAVWIAYIRTGAMSVFLSDDV